LTADNPAMSRRLTEASPEGSLFAGQLAQATQQLDQGADFFMLVNSFNEWHEDTQIEPVDGKATTLPEELTQGLEYAGYGTLYLDILHAYTSKDAVVTRNELPVVFNGPPYATDSIRLAAFYYSWFTQEDFGAGLRANLEPAQQLLPSSSAKIERDLHLSWQSNIRVWIMPWSRPGGHISDAGAASVFADTYLIESVQQIALFYYVHQRVVAVEGGGWDTSLVESDVHHLCQNYLALDSYYTTSSPSSRPVLFLGLTRVLHDRGSLGPVVAAIRNVAFEYGLNVYLVGDQIWNDAPTTIGNEPFQLLDAVLNHDVYGNMGEPQGYAGQGTVDDYYEEQRKWRVAAWKEGCSYLPTVLPGFNDRAVRLANDNPALSRNLTVADGEGSFFAACLDKAKHLLDSELNDMMFINSFNHFQEDTQIFPVYGGATDLPSDVTQGLTYTGYEETYLDLLTDRFGFYEPTEQPSAVPSSLPSESAVPTLRPSKSPSTVPSKVPSESGAPSTFPSKSPSTVPSRSPSGSPSALPSTKPSASPSKLPSASPSAAPTISPTSSPSLLPSSQPSKLRSNAPSEPPTVQFSCEDDPDWWSDGRKAKSCADIARKIAKKSKHLDKNCRKTDVNGVTGYEACPNTCENGAC
jgi:hypothetical protein